MGCPANPKKFLGLISYEGKHKWFLIGLDFLSWWSADYECDQCHAQKEKWPLYDVDLVRMGFDIEALRDSISGRFNQSVYGEDLQKYRK